MKLSRCGSSRNEGTVTRGLAPRIKWDAENCCIVFRDENVRDFRTDAHHDYEVRMSLEELAESIKVVAIKGIKNSAAEIDEAMEPACRALLRIVKLLDGTLSPSLQGIESE